MFPEFDSLGELAHITSEARDHLWFVMNDSIIRWEFALSGSEQNQNLSECSIGLVLGRVGKGAPQQVKRFMERVVDL